MVSCLCRCNSWDPQFVLWSNTFGTPSYHFGYFSLTILKVGSHTCPCAVTPSRSTEAEMFGIQLLFKVISWIFRWVCWKSGDEKNGASTTEMKKMTAEIEKMTKMKKMVFRWRPRVLQGAKQRLGLWKLKDEHRCKNRFARSHIFSFLQDLISFCLFGRSHIFSFLRPGRRCCIFSFSRRWGGVSSQLCSWPRPLERLTRLSRASLPWSACPCSRVYQEAHVARVCYEDLYESLPRGLPRGPVYIAVPTT